MPTPGVTSGCESKSDALKGTSTLKGKMDVDCKYASVPCKAMNPRARTVFTKSSLLDRPATSTPNSNATDPENSFVYSVQPTFRGDTRIIGRRRGRFHFGTQFRRISNAVSNQSRSNDNNVRNQSNQDPEASVDARLSNSETPTVISPSVRLGEAILSNVFNDHIAPTPNNSIDETITNSSPATASYLWRDSAKSNLNDNLAASSEEGSVRLHDLQQSSNPVRPTSNEPELTGVGSDPGVETVPALSNMEEGEMETVLRTSPPGGAISSPATAINNDDTLV